MGQSIWPGIKIGWATGDVNYDHPTLRRRFGFYAKKRGLQWKKANPIEKYDLTVVHHSADLTVWRSYDKGRIVFDYNDDYLAAAGYGFRSSFRGMAKFLTRQYKYLEIDFAAAYVDMMKRADAVICATDAQVRDVSRYCCNIHLILDMQCDPAWVTKTDYQSGSVFNLVWEGLPFLSGFSSIMPVLDRMKERTEFALHLITALKSGRYLNHYLPVHTKDKVLKMFALDRVFLYEWNDLLFSKIVTACDLGLIPIPMDDPFWAGKPANKLLFFWRMGLPVLTSATPEYSNAMEQCGLEMTCESLNDWEDKLERYMNDENARRDAGTRGKAFVDAEYSEEKLLSLWDRAFLSVL